MAMKKWWRFAAHWVHSPGQKLAIQSLSRWHGTNLVAAALVALATLSFSGLVHSQTDPMVDPSTGKPYPRGTASYKTKLQIATELAANPNMGLMTQTDINAITDPVIRRDAQWRFDQAKKWPTQADGIERSTDKDAEGRERRYFTPPKLTAADCLVGRHWELVGGYAGCVCDGDTTHTRVSNDDPAACSAPPPPPPPPKGGGSVAAGFTFGGLGSPTGHATPSTSKISGTWTMTANYGTSIDLTYTGGLGSVSGIFSGTCNFTLYNYGNGDWGLAGPCGTGTAYGSGGVYINFNGPTYKGTFNGSWSGSGASGTLSATVNDGVLLFDISQGSTTGFVLMDSSGSFTGYTNGSTITGYINGDGIGAINVGGPWYAAMTGSGVFGTITGLGTSWFATGGPSGNFFVVNASGSIVGNGSLTSIATGDVFWAAYFASNGLTQNAGVNGVLTLPGNSLFYPCTPLSNGANCIGVASKTYTITSP